MYYGICNFKMYKVLQNRWLPAFDPRYRWCVDNNPPDPLRWYDWDPNYSPSGKPWICHWSVICVIDLPSILYQKQSTTSYHSITLHVAFSPLHIALVLNAFQDETNRTNEKTDILYILFTRIWLCPHIRSIRTIENLVFCFMNRMWIWSTRFINFVFSFLISFNFSNWLYV